MNIHKKMFKLAGYVRLRLIVSPRFVMQCFVSLVNSLNQINGIVNLNVV